MNVLFKSLAVFIAMSMAISAAMADESTVPAISWEQHPEIAKISLTLNDHSILVRVKNASSTPKVLIRLGPDMFVMLFYVDDHGTLISLGYHPSPNDPNSYQEEGGISTELLPTGTTSSINITSEELAQIQTHPVIGKLIVLDPVTKQRYTIESSPKMLTASP